MITIRDFMETVNYRITEGSEFGWQCFGPNTYQLDSWDGDQDGITCGIVFDTTTQVVYQMEAHDYGNQRSYRWTHPEFRERYTTDAQNHGVMHDSVEYAYDHVPFTDLEVSEDMLDKARAIVAGKPYDTRVQVEIELKDHEWVKLMRLAHEEDITLNQMVEKILDRAVREHQAAQSA